MSLGDDSSLPAGMTGRVNAKEWMRGWEEGAIHVCERLAGGVPLLEVQREVQAILETHRSQKKGLRRPKLGPRNGPEAKQRSASSPGSWDPMDDPDLGLSD
jgi:hypothetical protein